MTTARRLASGTEGGQPGGCIPQGIEPAAMKLTLGSPAIARPPPGPRDLAPPWPRAGRRQQRLPGRRPAPLRAPRRRPLGGDRGQPRGRLHALRARRRSGSARRTHTPRALLPGVLRPRPTHDHQRTGDTNYGTTFQVHTPTPPDIAEVVLLRPGAVTHGVNQSQRGLELVISGTGAGTIDVESPPNANLAPPGWYLLFLLNGSRVPSEGRWIRVTP